MSLRLIGYRYSVYSWAARMALAEAGQVAEWQEADPFDTKMQDWLRAHHPFGRVPVLRDGDFRIYETVAILAYLLGVEHDRKRRARKQQVIGIADGYGYRPLVRQVFSHGVFRPTAGAAADDAKFAEGLAAAAPVLGALDEIAAEGLALDRATVGAADCHLAPMIGYFVEAPQGAALLAETPALARWFAVVSRRESYISTKPDLTELRAGS